MSTEEKLARLLKKGYLFCNTRETVFMGKPAGTIIVLYVLCNDLFYWGCADAENITHREIDDLYKMAFNKKYKGWGCDIWCCKKRNMKPQQPVIEKMKSDGVWDDELENLPKNDGDNE